MCSTNYTFNNNGNLTADANKGITSITYNHLNLPTKVNIGSNSVIYTYSATGSKYKKTTSDGYGTRYYFSNFEYDKNMNLEYIHTTEGRIRAKSNFVYDYYLKDHLGNTRVVFTDENNDNTPEVLQVDNYYPFGMRHGQANGFSAGGNTTQYMYNGKELQQDFKLDWYDYGWRMYDPAIARWMVVDPMIEKHYEWTGYAYAYNNPIRFIDVMGLDSADAAALTQAAENAVQHVKDTYDKDGTQAAHCNVGVNSAFKELTGSDDLAGVNANDMIDVIESSDTFEEVELADVQDLANDGTIVVAGKKESGGTSGHVALGVPGEEVNSTSWGGDVPVVMDTGANKRTSQKAISYSWTGSAKDGVKYYKYTGSTLNTVFRARTSIGQINVTAKGSGGRMTPIAPYVKL